MKTDLQAGDANEPPEQKRGTRIFPQAPPIPHHVLLRRIGWGSYGEVWLARNSMGVYRAVKIVSLSSFDDAKPFERELSGIRKFEPVSRTHEGFIDVLQVGLDENGAHFFYVMELADDHSSGATIQPENYSPKTLASEIAARGRLSAEDCIGLGSALARAIQELHKRGLVHRDIKPSNILFVEGVPKLADIGLVASMDGTRSYVGTEGFIAPEGPGTPQSDIFSLGKVLYEACTGKDRQFFPELPADVSAFPDAARFMELNEVILRACRNAPVERYASAAEMQADLVVLLDGGSVKRLRHLERRWATVKRGALVVVASLAVTGVISYPFYRNHRENVERRQREIGSAIANGNHALESGDLLGSLPYFASALRWRHESQMDEKADRVRLGAILSQCPKMTHFWRENDSVIDINFSSDGRHLAVTAEHNKCRIYDVEEPENPRVLVESPYLESASYSPDGSLLAIANDDSTAQVFEASTLALIATFPHPNRVKSARISPDGTMLLTTCNDGIARIWNIKQQTVEHLFAHTAKVRDAEFSHDGRLVATASEDGTACLWDAISGMLVTKLVHPSWVTHIAFSPDDSQVVTACADHNARVWTTNGLQRFPVLAHEDTVLGAEYSPDGRVILTSSLDGTARLWQSSTLTPVEINPVLHHVERVRCAAFGPDGRCIAIGGNNGAVVVWDLSGQSPPPSPARCAASGDGTRLLTLTGAQLKVTDETSEDGRNDDYTVALPIELMKVNQNGSIAALVNSSQMTSNKSVTILDLSNTRRIVDAFPVRQPNWAVCLSDDGKRAAIIDGSVANVWDVESQRQQSVNLSIENVGSAILDATGKRLIAWHNEGDEITVSDLTTGKLCFDSLKMDALVRTVHNSPDGTEIIASCWDADLTPCYGQVWSLATGNPVGPRLVHGDGVLDCRFNPESSLIASASEDFTAGVWDVRHDFRRVQTVRHHGQVRTIAFNSDGDSIITGSEDKTARVWSAQTGEPLTPALRHFATVTNVIFLGDGTRVLTDTRDGSCVWNIEPDIRPIDDLFDLADLLCASPLNENQNKNSGQSSDGAQATWRRLRGIYPASFIASKAEIARWHEFTYKESAAGNNREAANFHARYTQSQQGNENLPKLAGVKSIDAESK